MSLPHLHKDECERSCGGTSNTLTITYQYANMFGKFAKNIGRTLQSPMPHSHPHRAASILNRSLAALSCSNLLEGKGVRVRASQSAMQVVAMESQEHHNEPKFKSLASWKTWWSDGHVSLAIAEALVKRVETMNLVGGSLLQLSNCKKIQEHDLQAKINAQVAEAVLEAYPADKEPSGYLLGDAILRCDSVWGHVMCGKPSANPLEEKDRRSRALKEGSKVRLLLSYMRHRASRSERGRTPEVTYLKELCMANQSSEKRGRKKSSPLSSPTGSTVSGPPSTSPQALSDIHPSDRYPFFTYILNGFRNSRKTKRLVLLGWHSNLSARMRQPRQVVSFTEDEEEEDIYVKTLRLLGFPSAKLSHRVK